VAAVEQVAADQLLTPITVDPVVAVQQVQLQEHLLQNLAAAVGPVGQTAAAVDLVAAEMEQIMLVTVVIVDRLTVAVAVAETGTPVVYQVVLEL
tara:strand:+ start:94 stop:375 length:282 start_codon:yes stop_codon:yes gene_type:complete